jgi:hypothetical protein
MKGKPLISALIRLDCWHNGALPAHIVVLQHTGFDKCNLSRYLNSGKGVIHIKGGINYEYLKCKQIRKEYLCLQIQTIAESFFFIRSELHIPVSMEQLTLFYLFVRIIPPLTRITPPIHLLQANNFDVQFRS